MSGDLDDLARAAADALVSAMLTDSWAAAKPRFAALVGHERRMDTAHAELAAASGLDRDRMQLAQARIWTTRLRDALDDDPRAVDGLRALLANLSLAPPAAAPAFPYEPAPPATPPAPRYEPVGPERPLVNADWNTGDYTGEVYAAPAQPDRLQPAEPAQPAQPDRFGPVVAKKTSAARPIVVAAAAVVVVLAAAAVAGWSAHWPRAIFGTASPVLTWRASEAPLPPGANASPPGGFEAAISGIACPAATGCVAAGWYVKGGDDDDTLIETLSGGRWVAQPPLSAGEYQSPLLFTVTCPAPGRCIAGGSYTNASSGDTAGLIDALSGGTWTPSSLSPPSGAGRDKNLQVDDLACSAVGNCVGVGSNWYNSTTGVAESQAMTQTLANGAWAPAEAPLPADAADAAGASYSYLYGVTCVAAGSCIAVGSYANKGGDTEALIETLAEGTWTATRAPLPADAGIQPRTATTVNAEKVNALNYVACTAPGSCVAVGTYTDKSGGTRALIENLANGTWVPAAAPLPKGAPRQYGAVLWAVACAAPSSCVAVGSYDTSKSGDQTQGLIESLAGGTWTAARAPIPANAARNGQVAAVYTVACATTASCVAGGEYIDSQKRSVALLEAAALFRTGSGASS